MSNPQANNEESPAQTKMKSPAPAKMVRIQAKRPIMVNEGKMLKPGQTATVTEAEAKEFTREFRCPYQFSGERTLSKSEKKRENIVRAVVVP